MGMEKANANANASKKKLASAINRAKAKKKNANANAKRKAEARKKARVLAENNFRRLTNEWSERDLSHGEGPVFLFSRHRGA